MAVSDAPYRSFFLQSAIQYALTELNIKLIVFDVEHSCNCPMDKLNAYRTIIKEVLTRYYELDLEQPSPGVEAVLAFDEVREHYFWAQVGWNQRERTCGSTVYIRIKDGKVWVEEDLTEDGITNDLLEAGIPKHDIVLGFQHPFLAGFN